MPWQHQSTVPVTVAALALFTIIMAAATHAQAPEPGQETPPQEQVTPPTLPPRCERMKQHMEQMHQRMQEMDDKLQQRLTAMDEAVGQDGRMDAMEAAIRELITQRRQMHDMRMQMMQGMMRHMGDHMDMGRRPGRMMMRCPLWQADDDVDADDVKDEADDE